MSSKKKDFIRRKAYHQVNASRTIKLGRKGSYIIRERKGKRYNLIRLEPYGNDIGKLYPYHYSRV